MSKMKSKTACPLVLLNNAWKSVLNTCANQIMASTPEDHLELMISFSSSTFE